jgi:hypothetical protein
MRVLPFALLVGSFIINTLVETEALAQDSHSKLGIFFNIAPEESKSLFVKDASGNQLKNFNWKKGLPTYIEFSLPAKRYSIDIPGPIRSIEVETSSDAQTFVQFAPYITENGEQGVEIKSWRGAPSPTITKAISQLKDANVGSSVVKWDLKSNGSTILFSTDPPWPNPFEKPSPPPIKQ